MASEVEQNLPSQSFGDLKQDAITPPPASANVSANCSDSNNCTNASVDTDHVMEDVCESVGEAVDKKVSAGVREEAAIEDVKETSTNVQEGPVNVQETPGVAEQDQEVQSEEDEEQKREDAGTPVAGVGLPETTPPCDSLQLQLVNELLACPCPDSSIVQPPGKLSLPLPRDGFMCDQCGDRFVLPASLAQHVARRVMNIFYRCPDCERTVLMYNKCQFLEHLDSHSLDPENLDASLVDVQPLGAADLCSPTKVFPPSEDSLLTGPPKLTRMVQLNKVKKPVPVSCPVCNIMCSAATLSSHLCPITSGTTLDTAPPRCPDCAQPCPTECSLIAHQGLHKPDLWPYPYICPECGVKILGTFDEYRQHVIAECLHLTRDLKSCCSVCLIEVGDVSAHMLHTHVQKLYKCRLCPLAFESVNGFSSHVRAKHDEQETFGSEAPCLTILKCPFCSATFNNGKTLREHMAGVRHGARVLEVVKFVFRCPTCDLDYGRKELLADHMARSHPDFRPVLPAIEEAPAPAATPMATPTIRGGDVSTRGRGRGRPARLSHADVKGESRAASQRCAACGGVFRQKAELVEHARAHLQAGVLLCLLCNVQFDDEQQLKVHMAEHAGQLGCHRCGLCYTRLGSRDALQQHLEAEHNMRDFTCQLCRLVFSRLADLHRHSQAKHGHAGRGGRQAKRSLQSPPPAPARSPVAAAADAEDDLPLSVTARAATGRRGTLPAVTSLYQLDESMPGSPGAMTSPGSAAPPRHVNRRGRPRGGNTAAAVRAAAAALKLKQEQGDAPVGGDMDDAPFVEKPQPPLPSSGYRCVHCGWESGVRATFITHVRRHRTSVTQHQCVECGQCYATQPSLRKHLLLVHKVRRLPAETDAASESERWRRVHQAPGGQPPRREAETLEQIAQFVAASGPGVEVVDGGDDGDEQVIELEMKEGEITQKQLHVAVRRPGDSSDEEEEQPAATEVPTTNGQAA